MSSLGLGDTLCVIVWRKGLNGGNPLAYPVEDEEVPSGQRIEVINGQVDTVAQIRIESVESSRAIGRAVDEFKPGTTEWEDAVNRLGENHDLSDETIEQSNRKRTTIRSDYDYENQWKKQKQRVLDELPERD